MKGGKASSSVRYCVPWFTYRCSNARAAIEPGLGVLSSTRPQAREQRDPALLASCLIAENIMWQIKMLLSTALPTATGRAPHPLHPTLTLKGTADL